MKSRLTLSIDQDLKLFARQYAKDHNTSISRMVEDLIRSLDYEIHSPQVKALCNTLNIEKYDKGKRIEEKYLEK